MRSEGHSRGSRPPKGRRGHEGLRLKWARFPRTEVRGNDPCAEAARRGLPR